MSLLVYECPKSDVENTSVQWDTIKKVFYEYYHNRCELVLLIINLKLDNLIVDGLLLKDNIIMFLELKPKWLEIKLSQDDDNLENESKSRDSYKEIFQELNQKREILQKFIIDNQYLPSDQIYNFQLLLIGDGLNTLKTYLEDPIYAWVHVTEIEKICDVLPILKYQSYHNYSFEEKVQSINISKEEIFNFIRKLKINEAYICLNYSDINILPIDLYHINISHNGDDFSFDTLIKNYKRHINILGEQIKELTKITNALIDYPNIKENLLKYKSLLLVKKSIASKDLERYSLSLKLLNLEKSFYEDKLNESIAINSTLEDKIALVKILDENKFKKNTLDSYVNEKNIEVEELTKKINEIDKKIEKQNNELLNVNNSDINNSSNYNFEVEAQIISHNSDISEQNILSNNEFNYSLDILDDDQLDIVERCNDKNMLVTGPAGCGKTLIAVHKARQLMANGFDVILIAFTKSLKNFMQNGDDAENRFYYYLEWKKANCPKADYIIVDEVQDFSYEEILNFINSAKKYFFFFGDTAQSIMKFKDHKPMSIAEIAEKFNLKPLRLYTNYRLPRDVARITQDYVGVGVQKYSDRVYKNRKKKIPHIISFRNKEEELEGLVKILQKHQFCNIGILVSTNDYILELYNFFTSRGIKVEFKWNSNQNNETRSNLNFSSSYPKILTYHSAKGLQFKTVIISSFHAAFNEQELKSLYVAMTRTIGDLYILHHEKDLPQPLSNIPSYLYSDSLES